MTVNAPPLAELNVVAIGILCREIGPVNTARFLTQFTSGFGNYTGERDALFGEMTVGEIAAQIKRKRERAQG
jgi:hypothetical protein